MPVNDDFSYTKSAFDFARTGHIVYNGWATAMLGWQIIWGAIVAKLSGYSFTAVRLSMLPFAAGSVYLLYVILARFGINAWNSTMGALTLGLSPIFIPLAASFMTDVPALFCILLCLYTCQRALQSSNDRSAVAWLIAATVSNLLDGTVRQIVWLGAVVMVPSAVWLLRSRRTIVIAGVLMWPIDMVVIACSLHWFSRQPYSRPVDVVNSPIVIFSPLSLVRMLFFVLTLLLFALPVLIASLQEIRYIANRHYAAASVKTLAFVLASLTLLSVILLLPYLMGQWLPNVVTQYGVMQVPDVGSLPVVLPIWVRLFFTILLVFSVAGFALSLMARPFRTCRNSMEPASRTCAQEQLRYFLVLTAPFAIAYVGTLVLRAATSFGIYDRYIIPLLPLIIAFVVIDYQEDGDKKLPWVSVGVLIIFALYAVAATHDYFSTQRARLLAAEQVQRTGIPRSQIHGSVEYDAWTQLLIEGYMNDPRIKVPRGAFHVPSHHHLPPANCRFWLADWLPSVHPRYLVVFQPQACLSESEFPPVPVRLWIPPFNRNVFVQKQLDGVDGNE